MIGEAQHQTDRSRRLSRRRPSPFFSRRLFRATPPGVAQPTVDAEVSVAKSFQHGFTSDELSRGEQKSVQNLTHLQRI
jgi:hypothetical protein